MQTSLRYLATATAIALLLCTALCFTSCYQAPPTVIDPVDENGNAVTTTTEELIPRPTVAVPEEQLTLGIITEIHDAQMAWSTIEGYAHEMTGDNTAHFLVADGHGAECSLNVTIDYDTGMLTEATLSFGDVSETILTVNVLGITRIGLLMMEATENTAE